MVECSGSAGGATGFAETRAALYERWFGAPATVERSKDGAPVDVSVHSPGFADRSFYTLVTSGMSDQPMAAPSELDHGVRRAELILYVDQPGPSLIRLLRTLALMPRRLDLWLGHGHTLPNGDPPAPLFPGSALDTLLLLETVVAPERDAWRYVTLDGEPLRLLNPIPISSRECALKLEQGLPALLQRFNEGQLSFVLDPGRSCLAAGVR